MISFFCQEVIMFPYCQLYKTWNTNPFASPHCHHPGLPSFISHNNYSSSPLNHSPAPIPIPLQFTAKWSLQRANLTSLPCLKLVNGFPLSLFFIRSSMGLSYVHYFLPTTHCPAHAEMFPVPPRYQALSHNCCSSPNFTSTSISLPSLRSSLEHLLSH